MKTLCISAEFSTGRPVFLLPVTGTRPVHYRKHRLTLYE